MTTLARDRRLFLPWVALACVCCVLMYVWPGEETLPYHLGWIAIAIAYGIEPWPWRQTVLAVLAYTAVTGGILVARASSGVLIWGETAEIPIMSLLMLVVVTSVRSRHDAYATLREAAAQERLRAEQRERLARMTSHEMRTPATIAIGYCEVLLASVHDEAVRADLHVIHDELSRLVLTSERLTRMMQVQLPGDVTQIDVAALLTDAAERWSVLADRDFVVECSTGPQVASADRLRACLDTLIENAVRYTSDKDTVRLSGSVVHDTLVVSVADSGPGLDPRLATRVNQGTPLQLDGRRWVAPDPRSRTGLGLALVQECALARGGRLVAGRSREGGALLAVAVPAVWDGRRVAPAQVEPVQAPAPRDPSPPAAIAAPA